MHATSIVHVSELINKRGLTAFQITIVVLCFLVVGIDGSVRMTGKGDDHVIGNLS